MAEQAPKAPKAPRAPQAPKTPYQFSNTNAWSTRQMVTMALMCAIAALLQFVQIPLIPGVPFLTYDPSLMPAMVCGFAYGPAAGVVVGAMAAVIHGLLLGEWVGSLMNIVATLCFVLPAALLYRRRRTYRMAVAGLALSVLCAIAGAIAANLTIGVAFWYGSLDVGLALVLPALLPFNLVKGVLNAVLTLVVYKAVSNLITPKKDQVVGK
ncbi:MULTISPECIES: ECF transporter S component [unclassified Adlercreutzia]|uniref:ECF transporter S component n=1 Tax=unclassified Adlercreutzia TaxID=2636013 RepID=UPI0013EC0EA4|nr:MULTISPECIES: ECF transporter S component [unclassified Adlercreutzia]